ncbi:MAG: hypothetical protein K9J16_17740 [Melioribacteraceae bacterium]|nr:hypothetical protein [Melioribacteraceae bacterium]MCF8356727.1 hypothetical protein [Melioribacteraceae bacterium]MCF8396081.1 hypothetical protein [Melioribacteraceae bacterium]MCF8421067.1 hypothetical protein [Melioribacteraceae bacterium]
MANLPAAGRLPDFGLVDGCPIKNIEMFHPIKNIEMSLKTLQMLDSQLS